MKDYISRVRVKAIIDIKKSLLSKKILWLCKRKAFYALLFEELLGWPLS